MNDAPSALPTRRAWLGAAWLAVLALAGCGPGVGGSGTGLQDNPGPAAPPAAPTPAAPIVYVDTGDGRQLQARLEGARLRIAAPCLGIDFDGLRSNAADVPLGLFDGLLAGTPPRAARAEVQVVGNDLLLTLRDAAGTVLLGPLALRRNDAPPPLQACP